jgi:histidine phosphotransferase ChpT
MADADLARTLCARICHDLSGSVGAVLGMLELAAEGADPEALRVAQSCARDMAGRLRLVRAAWGTEDAIVGLAGFLPGLPGAERLTLDETGLAPGLEPALLRVALGMMMAGADALKRGGLIRIGDATGRLTMEIDGPTIVWPDLLLRCLAGPEGFAEAVVTPRGAGYAMLYLDADRLGLKLQLVSDRCMSTG